MGKIVHPLENDNIRSGHKRTLSKLHKKPTILKNIKKIRKLKKALKLKKSSKPSLEVIFFPLSTI